MFTVEGTNQVKTFQNKKELVVIIHTSKPLRMI